MPNVVNGITGKFQRWVATLPSTNMQLTVALSLSVIVVLTLLVCLVIGRELQEGIVDSLLIFVVSLTTAGVVQFGVKRVTTKPEIINALAAAKRAAPLRTTTTETTEKTTETVPGSPT